MLNREQILGFNKPRTKVVDVPEWGGSVTLRSMNVRERGEMESLIQSQRGNIRGVRARMLLLCCLNDDGSQMFTAADEPKLEQLDCAAEKLVEAAMLLCGLTKDATEGKSPTGQ